MKTITKFLWVILIFGCAENVKDIDESEFDKVPATTIISSNTSAEEDAATYQEDDKTKGIEFGFSNELGNQILMVGVNNSLSDPLKFTTTISIEGNLTAIDFVEKKESTDQDNRRQNYYNFKNSGGYLYNLKAEQIDKYKAALLFKEKFLTDRKYLDLRIIENEELTNSIKKLIETDKSRKIKNGKIIALINEKIKVVIADFEIKNDSALACLALIYPEKIVYKDLPAVYNEISTWRVDDGGRFVIENYHILAAFEEKDGIEIVTEWIGAEGYLIEYLKEINLNLETLKRGHLYTAPI
jgi:hypothetical protein